MSSGRPLRFHVRGMDCAEEVAVLRRAMEPLVPREEALSFDVLSGQMIIFPPEAERLRVEDVVKAVQSTGLRAEPAARAATELRVGWFERRSRTVLTFASGVLAALAFAWHSWLAGSVVAALGSEGLGVAHGVPIPVAAAYTLSILCGICFVLPKAWAALRTLRPDMNLLMTIAACGAIAIGEWFEAAAVTFLFSLSLTLEAWSMARARKAIGALMSVAPESARVRGGDGRESDEPPERVGVGSLIVVRPGERVPLDGTVERGISAVNQAPITGESMPVSKAPGDEVFAGTINGDSAIEVRTTKAADDTVLSRIVRMVVEAQGKRAPAELWVERFARIYTPTVLVVALVLLLVPPLALGSPWQPWIYRSLVLLVIACPCALVISTPVTIVAALTAAARAGALVKGGAHLEVAARLQALAMDKTGTLTEGRPHVVETTPHNDHSERELLSIAASIEARSDHPLARAIVEHADGAGITYEPAQDLQIVQGRGATAVVSGRRYWLGSHRYLEEWDLETPEVHRALEGMSSSGRSVVVVGDGTHVCGFIGLADRVRPEARSVVDSLHRVGIRRVVVLTGDNHGTADAIAREVGIDEVRAELLPDDNVRAIEQMAAIGQTVAMVGDGINDAPALARAHLGIAMGAAGSDAAIETADVALMSDDLGRIPWLVQHARRALRIVRQNIFVSLTIKAVFVGLTALGVASLWAAISADMGASLLVIFNGLRLLRGAGDGSRT